MDAAVMEENVVGGRSCGGLRLKAGRDHHHDSLYVREVWHHSRYRATVKTEYTSEVHSEVGRLCTANKKTVQVKSGSQATEHRLFSSLFASFAASFSTPPSSSIVPSPLLLPPSSRLGSLWRDSTEWGQPYYFSLSENCEGNSMI